MIGEKLSEKEQVSKRREIGSSGLLEWVWKIGRNGKGLGEAGKIRLWI